MATTRQGAAGSAGSAWPLGGATAALVALGSAATAWLVLTGTGSVAPGNRTALPAVEALPPGGQVVVVPPLDVPPAAPPRGSAGGGSRPQPGGVGRGSGTSALALPGLSALRTARPVLREAPPAAVDGPVPGPPARAPDRVEPPRTPGDGPQRPDRPRPVDPPPPAPEPAPPPPPAPPPAPAPPTRNEQPPHPVAPAPAAPDRPSRPSRPDPPAEHDNVVPDRGLGHDQHHRDGGAKGHRHR